MSPENDPPQHDDEATPEALSATEADENPKTHTGVPNRDESDETMTTFKPPQIDMELAARTIAQTARAAQRVRDTEAELAAAREAEVAVRAIRRGSLDPDEALKLALDLIGRRTDIVAVQLPEPDANIANPTWIIDEPGFGTQVRVNRDSIDGCVRWGPVRFEDTAEVREFAAALLAAANVADAAEDGGK